MRPKIIAHRGYSEKYPENTLLSFKKALEAGADGVELDVFAAKDKELIVHHDYYLGRTNNGGGLVFRKKLKYLKNLDAGGWFDKRYSGERIPSLEEVFKTIGKTRYEIELKGLDLDFALGLAELTREYGLSEEVEFTSFHLPLLLRFKQKMPGIKIGMFALGMPEWMENNLWQEILFNDLISGQFAVIHCSPDILDEKFIDRLHKANIKVASADCNDRGSLKKAYDLGVDQVSTDKVELAVGIRGAKV